RRRPATELVVHADGATLDDPDLGAGVWLDGGPALAMSTFRRLACDAGLVLMVHGPDGLPIDVGRRTRTIPTALRRALDARDPTCRYPGCTATLFLEGHHIQHWVAGGPTNLHNLANFCSFHHDLHHKGGFTVDVLGGGRLRFLRPDGSEIGAEPTAGSAEALRERNAGAGLRITPGTGDCRWEGERLDLDHALAGLAGADGRR
ncbi:MAG: HNH endonuclease, partial [Actinomycetota bacterium]|nr:HNH endonuclease [Actinomycetota bacterium]